MTPQEFIYNFIEQLQKTEVEKPPEMVEYISALQTIADSDDKEAHERAMQNLLELGKKLVPAEQIEQKTVLPLTPEPESLTEEKVNSTWETTKAIFNFIRQEYPRYKQWAIRGIAYGAIFLGILTILSLFYSWDTTGINLINQARSNNESNILKFFKLDYIFICLMVYKWILVIFIPIVFFYFWSGEGGSVKKYFLKFGVEIIIIWAIVRSFLMFVGIMASADYELLNMNYFIPLRAILSFLGWCAVWSLIVLYLFQRARVGNEAKLYFSTFGIELVINTIRLYILFVLLYVPIFIGAIFYVSSQGGNFDKSYTNLPYEVAGFWGWWIPLILGSINLAMSLGIFFGWNAPISGIKLSFDSRDMTGEEKDYMIGFYRRLVESGRPDEKVFKSWNVIESSGIFAFTYGENIFISRGAFQERYFNALVAHEIGHLHQRDGLILQALHSFTYPLFNHLLFNPTTIQRGTLEQDKDFSSSKSNFLLSGIISSMTIMFFTLFFGGWSVQVLARFWSKFYINRDYLADDYAVSLGFAGELLNYLDSYKDFDTSLPLFNRWRGYTRVRIERVRAKIEMSY